MTTLLFILALLLGNTVGLDNGAARTPPMGWNPYNVYLLVSARFTTAVVDSECMCILQMQHGRISISHRCTRTRQLRLGKSWLPVL